MSQSTNEDIDLVAIWVRKDPIRWFAGALAGGFAGLISLGFAMLLLKTVGLDPWFAVKVPALPVLGPSALEIGFNVQTIMVGLAAHEGLCIFLGFVYAHFTGTNSFPALFGVGLAWGAFTWVFVHNLFTPAWRDVFVAGIPSGATFFVCMVFGLALTSVAFFDRMLRGFAR